MLSDRQTGFDLHASNLMHWAQLPPPKRKLAPAFRALSDDELLVQQVDVVARRMGPEADRT